MDMPPATDFGRVEGLPGVYLANQLDKRVLSEPRLDYTKYIQTKARASRRARPRRPARLDAALLAGAEQGDG
jgi:hypothetical protein